MLLAASLHRVAYQLTRLLFIQNPDVGFVAGECLYPHPHVPNVEGRGGTAGPNPHGDGRGPAKGTTTPKRSKGLKSLKSLKGLHACRSRFFDADQREQAMASAPSGT
jgi:hypothetical protein